MRLIPLINLLPGIWIVSEAFPCILLALILQATAKCRAGKVVKGGENMYIIIAGCSKVGASLVNMLSEEDNNIVVIDRDKNNFLQLGSGSNCMTITGMPIDEDVLREAGIEKADALAAVTPDDNTNIMVAQIAQQLYHVPKVIMQTNDPERQRVLTVMGLQTICPTMLAVESFFYALKKGGR